MFKLLPLICVALLVSCTRMPELAAPAPPAGPPPTILPLAGLLAQMPPPGSVVSIDPTGLSARAARLRARAAAMRGPVTDPATRARLAAYLT